jgi:hypothetical protein
VTVDTTVGDGQFVVLSPTKDGLTIGFQRGPNAKAGKNRLHLDLIVDDLDRATDEIETIGGRSGRSSGSSAALWPRINGWLGSAFCLDASQCHGMHLQGGGA